MRPKIFVADDFLQNLLMFGLIDCSEINRDTEFEVVRIAAVLKPLQNFGIGINRRNGSFNSRFCATVPVNIEAVLDGFSFFLKGVGSIVPVHGEVTSQNVKQPFGQFVDAGINPQGVDFILPGFHHLGYGLSQSHRLRVFLERNRKLLHHVVSSQAVVTHPHTLHSLSSPCPTLPLAEPCRCGQGMAHRLPAE